MKIPYDFAQLVLHQQNLKIRRMDAADLVSLWQIYSDPEVMRFASDPPFDDPAMMQQFYASVLAGYASGAYYELAILSGEGVIGTCSIHAFDAVTQQIEIGYLLQRGYWRRGIMSAALSLLIPALFTHLPLERIVAEIDPENIPSRRLVAKLGFHPLPDNPKHFFLPRPHMPRSDR
jgi:RimJ/RimL family protein N-acetyltransferase